MKTPPLVIVNSMLVCLAAWTPWLTDSCIAWDGKDSVLVRGSFGFREIEWNGINDPNNVIQEPMVVQDILTASWAEEIAGYVASKRYNIGPPPNGMENGCWVDGSIHQSTRVTASPGNQAFEYRYAVFHSGSYYSFCGVNIHDWITSNEVEFFAKGPIGSAFAVSGHLSGSEYLTEDDDSFDYTAVFSGTIGMQLPLANQSVGLVQQGTTTGPEIQVDNEVYSRAFTLRIDGVHHFGLSNILFCPFVPWHTSTANVKVDLTISKLDAGVLLGDINRDGSVNLLDVAPFVDLLAGMMFQAEADLNQDGAVDLLDVQTFVDLLTQ